MGSKALGRLLSLNTYKYFDDIEHYFRISNQGRYVDIIKNIADEVLHAQNQRTTINTGGLLQEKWQR